VSNARATCIVLAGGLGTRLRAAVPDRPKCLAPVGQTSFLAFELRMLAQRGVRHFVLALGHQARLVLQAIEPLLEEFSLQPIVEPEALGTGGALLNAMDRCGLVECMVANGDTWLDADLSVLLRPLDPAARERLRIGCIHVNERGRYGGVLIGPHGRVKGFAPKGAQGAGLISAGAYRVHRDAFGGMPVGSAFSLESDLLPRQVDCDAVTAVNLEGEFIDIGVPEDYRRFCAAHG
jgi:D-glycero-alpha-D-manno-heptose 1-phosphate guanylyltransferase